MATQILGDQVVNLFKIHFDMTQTKIQEGRRNIADRIQFCHTHTVCLRSAVRGL